VDSRESGQDETANIHPDVTDHPRGAGTTPTPGTRVPLASVLFLHGLCRLGPEAGGPGRGEGGGGPGPASQETGEARERKGIADGAQPGGEGVARFALDEGQQYDDKVPKLALGEAGAERQGELAQGIGETYDRRRYGGSSLTMSCWRHLIRQENRHVPSLMSKCQDTVPVIV
jgi:hypothetical protein